MSQKQHHHKQEDTVRLTIDFPAEQHAYLKMLAARKGISMRQYVIESLCKNVDLEAKHIDLSENKFKRALNKIIKENDDVLRRLAKK
jgi:Antitoxin ParD